MLGQYWNCHVGSILEWQEAKVFEEEGSIVPFTTFLLPFYYPTKPYNTSLYLNALHGIGSDGTKYLDAHRNDGDEQ